MVGTAAGGNAEEARVGQEDFENYERFARQRSHTRLAEDQFGGPQAELPGRAHGSHGSHGVPLGINEPNNADNLANAFGPGRSASETGGEAPMEPHSSMAGE